MGNTAGFKGPSFRPIPVHLKIELKYLLSVLIPLGLMLLIKAKVLSLLILLSHLGQRQWLR
jgi:hypothetical protein